MQYIFGAKNSGKTTLMGIFYKKSTYNFNIIGTQQLSIIEAQKYPQGVVNVTDLSYFKEQLNKLKNQVADVLPLQAKLTKLPYNSQLEVIKRIENGKQKYPTCRIACYDDTIKKVYEKCQIKYDGYLLQHYTITILIDDIDKKFTKQDDNLLDIIFNMQEYRIQQCIITQSSIKPQSQINIQQYTTNYLNVLQPLITTYTFLGGCDSKQFVELYQLIVTKKQEAEIEKIYTSLPHYHYITLRYNNIEFCVEV